MYFGLTKDRNWLGSDTIFVPNCLTFKKQGLAKACVKELKFQISNFHFSLVKNFSYWKKSTLWYHTDNFIKKMLRRNSLFIHFTPNRLRYSLYYYLPLVQRPYVNEVTLSWDYRPQKSYSGLGLLAPNRYELDFSNQVVNIDFDQGALDTSED